MPGSHVTRDRSSYICGECGYVSPGWLGRCPGCGQWNTIVEEPVRAAASVARAGRSSFGIAARDRTAGQGGARGLSAIVPEPVLLHDIDSTQENRISTGLGELNRVLGGGLVAGSVVLVGGEPGIGKSTLLLQALMRMEAAGLSTLLVSGEESPSQVKLRSARLTAAMGEALPAGGRPPAGNAPQPTGGAQPVGGGTLRLLGETQTEAVVACLENLSPAVCVVDSVQTLWSAEIGSTPGSVAQIREATSQLVQVAKANNVALVLVGHVTKEGELAGPRVLEHMVDAVLSFEGERAQPFRVLRAVKNRFGSTNEVGVFQMAEQGLVEVPDPSSLFLEDGDLRPGSAVVPVLEGSRCLLAEIQALVAPSSLAVPQRVSRGVDRNRLTMIVAVLARRARLPLLKSDIFVNVGGGLTVEDPAADLAVALAVVSAWRDGSRGQGVAAFGELSLTGRVRYAIQGEKRIQELARRGFKRILVPERNAAEFLGGSAGTAKWGVRLEAVADIGQAVDITSARSMRG